MKRKRVLLPDYLIFSRRDLNLIILKCTFALFPMNIFAQIIDFGSEKRTSECQNLILTGKTQEERDDLQKNCWIIYGVIEDLSRYREYFLANGKLINLFPTAYYHTTKKEFSKILSGAYNYPNEKMRQMIAFYDAYKFNRDNWDIGNTDVVERHWKQQFEYAGTGEAENNTFCRQLGYVLSMAIVAHVKIDLPRAIRYAYNKRLDKSIFPSSLLNDFLASNDLFAQTRSNTIDDIAKARTYCNKGVLAWDYGIAINNTIYKIMPDMGFLMQWKEVLTDKDVIDIREKSFKQALFDDKPLQGWEDYMLLGQPLTNHEPLISVGKLFCPPLPPQKDSKALTTEEADENRKKIEELEKRKNYIDKPAAGKKIFWGGKTPDELGQKLLTALKTNNKDLWYNCIYSEGRERADENFDYIRERLQSQGVSNFKLLNFSRVTYVSNKNMGGGDYGFFKIEFNYGKDFYGVIGGGNFAVIYNGLFMIDHSFYNCVVRRK